MLFLILSVLFGVFQCDIVCDPVSGTPVNSPIGVAKGLAPGRVAWNYDRSGCNWDGTKNSYWWDPKNTDFDVVDSLLEGVVKSVGNDGDIKIAWDNLFKSFKKERGETGGYVKGETITIKVNFDVWLSYKLPPPQGRNKGYGDDPMFKPNGNANSVSPQIIKALFGQLVNIAGVDQEDIILYDASRCIPDHYYNIFGVPFPNVQYFDNEGGRDYVQKVEVDEDTMLYFSDPDYSIQGWNITKFPKVQTKADYFIEITAFEGHNAAGVSLSPKNLFGSIYTVMECAFLTPNPGYWCPMRGWSLQRTMKSYTPMVDLIGHKDTGGKALLYITDALYAGIDETLADPTKFRMKPFSGDWTCSIFASQDTVALDSVCFDFLRSEPNEPWPTVGCTDNFLHEEALAHNPPSGTLYNPSVLGQRLNSLGVHEHWNNADEMQYTRNLGTGEGIELIKVHEQ